MKFYVYINKMNVKFEILNEIKIFIQNKRKMLYFFIFDFYPVKYV